MPSRSLSLSYTKRGVGQGSLGITGRVDKHDDLAY